jgi:hypothetical protein
LPPPSPGSASGLAFRTSTTGVSKQENYVKENIRTSFTNSNIRKASNFIDKSKLGLNDRFENTDALGNSQSFFAPKEVNSVFLKD